MTLEGARQVHNRRLSRLECAKFAIARFQRLICCLWQEFSHGLQGFCTKIWPLILQGVLVVQFRGKNIPSFTAGVLGIPRANLDSVSEPYIWATFSERPYNRDDTAAILELPQKIEGDNWVEHGEGKEFYAVAQIEYNE
jgi:hypothetical protein